ncbi:MAG: class I SAM-dependent methyltransferase [Clostridia bacterium]|nr:class I SAM-dependent methyltransferase [Clostridia bacterium]
METEEIATFFDRVAPEYESMHLSRVDHGMEGKATLAEHLPAGTGRILDIGAGTGLELEAVFNRFPDAQVTVVDISENMLGKLEERFAGRKITVTPGDYFTADFGGEPYDAVITSMSLHHWTPDEKRRLYPRFYEALKPGGIYIENDYMLTEGTPEELAAEEKRLLSERKALEEANPDVRHVHMDLPATVPSEMKRLEEAGFSDVREVWSAKNNVTLTALRAADTQ